MFPDDISVNIIDVLLYKHKKARYHTNKREFYALSYRIRSQSKYIFKNKSISSNSNSVSFVPANVEYDRITNDDEAIVFHFYLHNCVINEIQVLTPENYNLYYSLFDKALKIWNKKETGYKYKVTSIFYEILFNLQLSGFLADKSKPEYICESAEYLKKNFSSQALTINNLAKRVHLSDAFFRRKFKQHYGISPKKYLDTLRIQYAISLLKTNYFNQAEIAQRCGFSDVKYFRTAFKTKTGMCISKYNYNGEYFAKPYKQ